MEYNKALLRELKKDEPTYVRTIKANFILEDENRTNNAHFMA